MITLTDFLLAFFAASGGSALGAIVVPKRSMESFHRELGFKRPRFWSAIIVFTLAFHLMVGAKDAFTGGSWLPWIVLNIVILVSWLVAFWLRGGRHATMTTSVSTDGETRP